MGLSVRVARTKARSAGQGKELREPTPKVAALNGDYEEYTGFGQ